MDKEDPARTMARGMNDPPGSAIEVEIFATLEDAVGFGAGHGLADHAGKIEHGVGAETAFGLMDVNRQGTGGSGGGSGGTGGTEAAQGEIHPRHVVGMAMSEQEGDGFQAVLFDGIEQGLGAVAAIDDPAILRIRGGDDKTVGLVVPKGEDGDFRGCHFANPGFQVRGQQATLKGCVNIAGGSVGE